MEQLPSRYIVAVDGRTSQVAECQIDWDPWFTAAPVSIRITLALSDADLWAVRPTCEVFDREEGKLFVFTGMVGSICGTVGDFIRVSFVSDSPIECFNKDTGRALTMARRHEQGSN